MNKDNKTRLFYVVDSIDDNEELYTTYQDAVNAHNNINFLRPESKPRLYIAEVKNAYYDEELQDWNYEDYSDTFNIVSKLI